MSTPRRDEELAKMELERLKGLVRTAVSVWNWDNPNAVRERLATSYYRIVIESNLERSSKSDGSPS